MNLDAMHASLRRQIYEEVSREMHWMEKEEGIFGHCHRNWFNLKHWLEEKIEREDRRLRGD